MTTSNNAPFSSIIVLTVKERDALRRVLRDAIGIRPEDGFILASALNQLEDTI